MSPWRKVSLTEIEDIVSGNLFGIQEKRLQEEEKVPTSAYRSILSRMIGAWNDKANECRSRCPMTKPLGRMYLA